MRRARKRLGRHEIRDAFSDLEWSGLLDQYKRALWEAKTNPVRARVDMDRIYHEASRKGVFERQDLFYLLEKDARGLRDAG